MEILMILGGFGEQKTNPIQSQTKPICRASAGNSKHSIESPYDEALNSK